MDNLCEYELNRIKLNDFDLAKKLVEKNVPNSTVLDCLAKMTEPRHADDVPTKIKVNKNAVSGGCKELFKQHYSKLQATEVPIGELLIENEVYTCDVEVILIMKALLDTGITYDKELSKVIHDVVTALVGRLVQGYMYKKDIIPCMQSLTKSYYIDQLIEGISDVIKV